MARVIVDGYNLIGTMHGDLERERERLTREMIAYSAARGHDLTLVFDGWKDGGEGMDRGERVERTGRITLVYSALGERADQAIARRVSGGDAQCIVVSSDREVQAHAWGNGGVAVDSDAFLRAVARALAGGPGGPDEGGGGDEPEYHDDDEEYEELYGGRAKKGNPRKASKRDKALQWAMGKL
jgi:hypothetical protein